MCVCGGGHLCLHVPACVSVQVCLCVLEVHSMCTGEILGWQVVKPVFGESHGDADYYNPRTKFSERGDVVLSATRLPGAQGGHLESPN